ncbi:MULTISPECIES: DUF6037 family protein [Fusobacterium]|uniref:DUF6037 family protein n=1 Tax=Fusobacterium TaxID=848 RepID=UPI0009F6571E|nr:MULTISPECIES: DUF6037 family protein [Fusobacterium]
MAKLRYENLKLLLNDMEKKEWLIDSFLFQYNNIEVIAILKRYKEKEKKPNEYAKAKLEFIKRENINNSINAYIDFYEVHFKNVNEFIEFFNIKNKNEKRNLFLDFAINFAQFIPKEKIVHKNDQLERRILGSRAEGNNINAIYCFDVRRNGIRENGDLNTRSIENSNKACILRPKLYELYKDDLNLSFFFSENQEDELSDEIIISNVAKRK